MKIYKLLLLSFLICFFNLNAFAQTGEDQVVKDENGRYFFETTKTVPDTKKEVLYKAIKVWVRKNLKSTDKINYDDENFENISATIAVATASGTATEFKFNVDIKDNKYRMSATSPIWYGYGKANPLGDFSGLGVPGFQKKKIINAYIDAILDISKSLENAAKNANNKSDW